MGKMFICILGILGMIFICLPFIALIPPFKKIAMKIYTLGFDVIFLVCPLLGVIAIVSIILHTEFVQNIIMWTYDYIKKISPTAWLFLMTFFANVIAYFASYRWKCKKYFFWLALTISVCFWVWLLSFNFV